MRRQKAGGIEGPGVIAALPIDGDVQGLMVGMQPLESPHGCNPGTCGLVVALIWA